MLARTLLLLLVPVLGLAGCGSSATETATDGGGEGGADMGREAGSDGGSDSHVGRDSGSDGGNHGSDGGGNGSTPTASLSTTELDFGAAGCGAAAAPTPLTLAIANSGGGTLTYDATLASTTQFTITSGSTGSVTHGGPSGDVVVSAVAVPPATSLGATLSTSLTLTTNDPAHKSIVVPVSITAEGAVLTLNPTNVPFPSTPVDTSASPYPVQLTNTGNASVTVSFGAATSSDFGVIYGSTDAGVIDAGASDAGVAPFTLAANATLPGLAAIFTPTRNGNESATIPIVVVGPVCGDSATTLAMSGTGSGGVYTSSTTDLYFGNADSTPGYVACGGAAAPAQTLTFKNTGNASFNWQGSFATGTYFSINPSGSNLLTPGATATVTITPTQGIPANSATTTDLYSDVLTITTDAPGDTPHQVELHETAYGAILAINPTTYGFGSTPPGTSITEPFAITNSGNGPASVTLSTLETDPFATTAFSVSPTQGMNVTSATPLTAVVTFTAPAAAQVYTANLSVTNAAGGTTGLCAPVPSAATLTGTSLTGSVAFSPQSLAFGPQGLVPCGTTAATETVTFTNTGNSPYTITPTLLRSPSPFTIDSIVCTSTTPSAVAPGGNCVITLRPETIPYPSAITPNLYGDILEVTTNVANDAPHYIPLDMTAEGAILVAETATVGFGDVYVGTANTFEYAFTNVGNAGASLDFTSAPPGSAFEWPSSMTINPQDVDHTIPVTFTPTAAGTSYSATIDMAENASFPLCQPLPFLSGGFSAIALSGIGTSSNLTIPARSLDFGKAACGSSPTNTQTITVTDNITENGAPAEIALLASLSSSTYFALSSASGCVGSCSATRQEFLLTTGQSVSFIVTPSPIAQNAPTSSHGITDVLEITDSFDNVTRSVHLQNTAVGAVLAFSPTTVAMEPTKAGTTSTAGGGFYVVNSGNQPIAGLGLTLGGTDPADFALSTTTFALGSRSAGNNNAVALTSRFTPPAAGPYSATVTLTSTSGLTGTCQSALPSAITITGTGQ